MPTSSDFDGGPAHIVCVGDDNSDDTAYRFSFRKLIRFMGPGILMSIAYVVSSGAGVAGCAAVGVDAVFGQVTWRVAGTSCICARTPGCF